MTIQTHTTETIQTNNNFVWGPHFDMFYKHYQHCRMALELMGGKTPDWIINYIAAFDLTTRYYTEIPNWKKKDPSLTYLLSTDMEYSQQQLSEISVSKQDNLDV